MKAEDVRRELTAALNEGAATERATVEARYGQVWDTAELMTDFAVKGFAAPYVVVKRKADGVVGSLMFQHHPRFYFSFTEDK